MEHMWSPWRMKYIEQHDAEPGCVFCAALEQEDGPENLIVHRGKLAFVIMNRFPYTSGHLMIVPIVHRASLEEVDAPARAEVMELIAESMRMLSETYRPEGFNIGANIGAVAGAGIAEHVHFHVVPRWAGDTNFMSTLAGTRVLPEALADSYNRLSEAWNKP